MHFKAFRGHYWYIVFSVRERCEINLMNGRNLGVVFGRAFSTVVCSRARANTSSSLQRLFWDLGILAQNSAIWLVKLYLLSGWWTTRPWSSRSRIIPHQLSRPSLDLCSFLVSYLWISCFLISSFIYLVLYPYHIPIHVCDICILGCLSTYYVFQRIVSNFCIQRLTKLCNNHYSYIYDTPNDSPQDSDY